MKSFSRYEMENFDFEEELQLDRRKLGSNSLAVPRDVKEQIVSEINSVNYLLKF